MSFADRCDRFIVIASCIGLATLVACETVPLEAFSAQRYYAQAMTITPPECDLTGVTIKWTGIDDVRRICGNNATACYFFAKKTIYTAHPSSWNDVAALLRVGHETMHACGAVHEVPK